MHTPQLCRAVARQGAARRAATTLLSRRAPHALLKKYKMSSQGRSACPAPARAAQEREREKQVAMIKAQYLGAEKQKKKVLKPSEKFRFNFDWEARAARAARARAPQSTPSCRCLSPVKWRCLPRLVANLLALVRSPAALCSCKCVCAFVPSSRSYLLLVGPRAGAR